MPQPNFTPFPVLKTRRLILRQVKPDDENEIFSIRSDEMVNRFLDRPKTINIREAREFIHKITEGISNDKVFYWGITFKKEKKIIGTICLWNISWENSSAETGFELHPSVQGQGIMQEALSEVIQFGFSTLGLRTIQGWTHAENHSSIRILERNNFSRDYDAENKNAASLGNMIIYMLTNPLTLGNGQ